ncbi:Ig-like domain-containing protein [Sinomicrobium oceani]|uniref:Ig-like domain-containing protein n=1 Tax=Sinomicrobium oceani TaxID=1150368 RepID=UPI00227C0AB8|nr:Ig-like domain-containing protein [Sinomicrobium oceani]
MGWSEDGKSITIKVEDLKPDKQYQLTIGRGLKNLKSAPLKQYLMDFKTKAE